MIKKIIVSATVLLIIAMTAVGINQKNTYTDITAQPDCLNNMYVGAYTEIAAINNIEKIKISLPESNVIIRAKPVGELETVSFQNRQMVQVEEVYKGSDIQVGDYIYITSENCFFKLQNHFGGIGDYFGNGYINIMRDDEEYLIFLDDIVGYDTVGMRDPVYNLKETVFSFFSYEERDNVIVEIPKEDNGKILYEKVKDNEFFVTTEKALQLVLELKHEMLAKYPR